MSWTDLECANLVAKNTPNGASLFRTEEESEGGDYTINIRLIKTKLLPLESYQPSNFNCPIKTLHTPLYVQISPKTTTDRHKRLTQNNHTIITQKAFPTISYVILQYPTLSYNILQYPTNPNFSFLRQHSS